MERVLGYRAMSLHGDMGLRQSDLVRERVWQHEERQALSRAVRASASQAEKTSGQDLQCHAKENQRKFARILRPRRS